MQAATDDAERDAPGAPPAGRSSAFDPSARVESIVVPTCPFGSADSMTVRTYEVAFLDLVEHPSQRDPLSCPCDRELFDGAVTVVEFHYIPGVLATAVLAWRVLQFAKQLGSTASTTCVPRAVHIFVGFIPTLFRGALRLCVAAIAHSLAPQVPSEVRSIEAERYRAGFDRCEGATTWIQPKGAKRATPGC